MSRHPLGDLLRPCGLERRILALRVALLVIVAAWPAAARSQGVDPQLAQAIGWYTGTLGRVDDTRAHALLLEAAADGDAMSRMWLARCYSRGRMKFEPDATKAAAIAAEVIGQIQRLADTGVTEAVFLMGTAYDEGLGVAADPAVAVRWFQRAADADHMLAQHNLGNAYADGRGVPQNDAMAVQWWRKAAEAGDAIPQLRLARMYEEGRGVAKDLTIATEWYRRAAERGNAQAATALRKIETPGCRSDRQLP